ncbi:YceI family protein [Pelagicoccus sp. SDUM812005]|uniref:YceI family protein n=1 Tax=Pelagicoccus sp. SDUM812005 TaxID=3041257 RepID=UPI00280F7D2D|nr:YceI family protein [Pelagicoccus sp. SDUM812005]MDQ8183034.1 YceI family protein [Pelagicoccus sp. SDUM812005]
MIPSEESIPYIDPDRVNASSMALIDVRSPEAFAECRIEGSQNLCVYETSFLQNAQSAFANKGEAIVVYGDNDRFKAAALAADRLKQAGYSDVHVLRGGLDNWIATGKDLSRGEQPQSPPAGTYTLNVEKSKIRWIGRNLSNQHEGTISCLQGFLEVDANGAAKSGKVEADMKRIHCSDITDTKLSSLLVAHLQSIDFFETERFPTATFSLDRIFLDPTARLGTPNARMEGQMVIRGVQHPLHLECSFNHADSGYVLQTQFDLDRTLFGVAYGSSRFFERLGMHLVNDLVNLQVTAFFEPSAS